MNCLLHASLTFLLHLSNLISQWINYWHIDADLSNKFGGAFVTAGGINAGADGSIMSILRSMMAFQMMIVGGDSWTSPFGAAATMYEVCWTIYGQYPSARFQF